MCRRLAPLALVMLVASAAPAAVLNQFEAQANPRRYAAEYRDPTWGGTYLRARWYDSQLPSFVARDAAPSQLNHYGYGGGDPLMRVDPSGASYRSSVGRDLERGVDKLNAGVGGHFARFLAGPILGPLQLLANPRGFWHAVEHNRGQMDVFLTVGIVGEAATSIYATRFLGLAPLPFAYRVGGEAVLGLGQTLAASFRGGGRHFDRHAFAQGLELTFGIEFVDRIGAGIGYQPFHLRGAAALNAIYDQIDGIGPHEAVLFRVREPPLTAVGGMGWTTPWQERLKLGFYHERLIAITRGTVYMTDAGPWGLSADSMYSRDWFTRTRDELNGTGGGAQAGYQFVGVKKNFDPWKFLANPRGFALDDYVLERGWSGRYNGLTNNSHDHVSAVLSLLGMR